jgi:hypothetical protein
LNWWPAPNLQVVEFTYKWLSDFDKIMIGHLGRVWRAVI